MTDLVKLYNKGKRTIIGADAGHLDADGEPQAYDFKPDSALAFSHGEAVKIMKLYPKEVVDLAGVTREFEEKTAEVEKAAVVSKSASDKKARKKEIEDAVAEAVAVALAKNNEMHEAARLASIKESEDEAADGKKEDAADKDDDGAAFAKINIGNVLGGKKK